MVIINFQSFLDGSIAVLTIYVSFIHIFVVVVVFWYFICVLLIVTFFHTLDNAFECARLHPIAICTPSLRAINIINNFVLHSKYTVLFIQKNNNKPKITVFEIVFLLFLFISPPPFVTVILLLIIIIFIMWIIWTANGCTTFLSSAYYKNRGQCAYIQEIKEHFFRQLRLKQKQQQNMYVTKIVIT